MVLVVNPVKPSHQTYELAFCVLRLSTTGSPKQIAALFAVTFITGTASGVITI